MRATMAAMTSEEEEGGGKNLMAALLIHKESNRQIIHQLILFLADLMEPAAWGGDGRTRENW